MPPSDSSLPQGPVKIASTDPSRLDAIHGWVHDQKYDPAEIRYNATERVLELPFLCAAYREVRGQRGVWPLISWWWVPVVRGYLRVFTVREYSVRDDGPGMINEISAPLPNQVRIAGISEISALVDQFEVTLELGDRIIGWVRMRWLLFAESESRIETHGVSDVLRSYE